MSRRRIRPELRTLVVQPDPRDASLTPAEALALQVRGQAAQTGRCVCGATLDIPEDLGPGFVVLSVEHEPDCPAVSPAAERAMKKLTGGEGR